MCAEPDELDPQIPFTPSLLPIYLALQASTTTAAPSSATPPAEPSASPTADDLLTAIAERVPGADAKARVEEAAGEVARAEGAELHNVAALTGGMVAQELIKIVTKQYIPIDNTCVYDGIHSRCQVLRL